ncbi:MAG TPA: aspartate carbamoyltransferase [Ramlibacter sp.]
MKKPILQAALALAFLSAVTAAGAADAARQADVARRGADVMPFSLAATQHVFTKSAEGGTQRVVARKTGDAGQVRLVRQHLREIEAQFRQGDFSGPAHIHGAGMPGLAQLQAAPRGAVAISYRDVPAGAELAYRTADPALVAAVHAWFDAQVSDHGRDARSGHPGGHGKHHR